MPISMTSRTYFRMMRGIKAFLNPKAGVVRGVLSRDEHVQSEPGRDQEITRLRRRLARAEKELAGLELRGTEGNPSEDITIFFVVSAPKSGTTWLRRMLDLHPDVLCTSPARSTLPTRRSASTSW